MEDRNETEETMVANDPNVRKKITITVDVVTTGDDITNQFLEGKIKRSLQGIDWWGYVRSLDIDVQDT